MAPGGDEVTIDLSGYKDRVGQRVLPGRYRVLCEDAETDTAKSGNQMINLWLRIVGGEFDGAVVVDRLVLTDNSLFRVVGFMQAIGLPTPKKRLKINLRQFIGKVLDVDLDDGDPYNGRVKSEVRGYMLIPKGDASDLPADLPEGDVLDDLPESNFDPDGAQEVGADDVQEIDLEKLDLG